MSGATLIVYATPGERQDLPRDRLQVDSAFVRNPRLLDPARGDDWRVSKRVRSRITALTMPSAKRTGQTIRSFRLNVIRLLPGCSKKFLQQVSCTPTSASQWKTIGRWKIS